MASTPLTRRDVLKAAVYYWLDPAKRVTGLIMTQILPFADHRAVKLYGQFERGVYDALKAV